MAQNLTLLAESSMPQLPKNQIERGLEIKIILQ
jgi:hypothetical protein